MRIACFFLVLIWMIQVSLLAASPQEKARSEPQEPVVPKETHADLAVEQVQVLMELETIQLKFLVRDSEGSFMPNLTAQDLTVIENGQEQNIALLKEQQVPIRTVVMVDNSYSTSQFLASFHRGQSLRRCVLIAKTCATSLPQGQPDKAV
jgi:hypothetical protein